MPMKLPMVLLNRIAVLLAACLALAAGSALARTGVSGDVAEAQLPQAARQTMDLIRHGGPFPYQRDGVVFGNRERALPQQPHGYYHEYTVQTPGARNRGARRIVCGGNQSLARDCYYSDDHYQSFRRIR
jgi:ribonuclease T1